MKALLFLGLLVLGLSGRAAAQVLADDAEGKSSIVQYANSINFDLAKAALSIDFNNYREAKIIQPKQILWGVSASARNAEGVATLFDGGQLTPESRLRLFVGQRRDVGGANLRAFRLLYVAGGINAASFRAYTPTASGALANRFPRTTYRGGFVDLGINYDYTAHWLFGGSVGYERANTFDDLTPTEYTLRTVDTLGKQQLISERKYTGYTGDFRLYDRANIRTDLLYFKALKGTDFQIAWNILYTRSFLSFNPEAARSRLDIGSGLNFYNVQKGSFLGGLYLQVTDVLNREQTQTNALGRLSFGVVAKYAFQSVVNRFR